MATVCDVVELKGKNRIIVKEGLEALKTSNDIGINALINQCKLNKKILIPIILALCLDHV